MKPNMGTTDKIIRLAIAAVIVALYFLTDLIPGTLGIILLVLAGVFVLTNLISVCPLYPIIGMNTKEKEK